MHEEEAVREKKKELRTLTFKKGILHRTEMEERINLLNKSEVAVHNVLPIEEEKRHRSPSPTQEEVKLMVKKLSFE